MYYLYVEFQRDWPDIRVEVEQSVSGGSQPLAEVLGIGNGGAESHDPHLTLYLRGHVAHARTDHFQYRLQGREKRLEVTCPHSQNNTSEIYCSNLCTT